MVLSRYNPTWIETKYLLVQSLKDILTLNVYDYNDHRKNTLMSAASFDLSKLLEDSTQEGIIAPLLKDGKDRGELRFDVNYYPVVEPEEGKEDILDSSTFFCAIFLPTRHSVHCRTFFQLSESCVSSSIKPRNSTRASHSPATSTHSPGSISTAPVPLPSPLAASSTPQVQFGKRLLSSFAQTKRRPLSRSRLLTTATSSRTLSSAI
jgi:hypothetical protein